MSSDPVLQRGDIYMFSAALAGQKTEQKARPCVILQNDCENDHRPVTIIAAISSLRSVPSPPFAVQLEPNTAGLTRGSVVNCGHIYTISKSHLGPRVGRLPAEKLVEVEKALSYLLGKS
jgi:mRNA interferase MazF